MNKQRQRIGKFFDIINTNNIVSIKVLSKELSVSEMTIRRDLGLLKTSGFINVINGVVISNMTNLSDINSNLDTDIEYFVTHQKGIHTKDKERIAKAAAKFVQPYDTIIIDVGTTTSPLLRYLPFNFPITVLCFSKNSLFEALNKNFLKLIFGGGFYHAKTEMFECQETCDLIKRIRATKVFISAAGVSETLGLTCVNEYEVNSKKSCINSAQTRILLVDSRKLGQVKLSYFASLKDIDIVITDNNISKKWIELFNSLNIELQIV